MPSGFFLVLPVNLAHLESINVPRILKLFNDIQLLLKIVDGIIWRLHCKDKWLICCLRFSLAVKMCTRKKWLPSRSKIRCRNRTGTGSTTWRRMWTCTTTWSRVSLPPSTVTTKSSGVFSWCSSAVSPRRPSSRPLCVVTSTAASLAIPVLPNRNFWNKYWLLSCQDLFCHVEYLPCCESDDPLQWLMFALKMMIGVWIHSAGSVHFG